MAAIYPGKGLGSLSLGLSLHSVIAILKASPTTFPSISITYSKKNPVRSPVTIVLKYNGLRLRFDGITQKLRLIEVIEWAKMKLTYKNRDVGGQGPPSYTRIYNDIFGPTFPGRYYNDNHIYVLSYPGIAFSFNIPSDAIKNLDPSQDIPRFLMTPSAPQCTAMAIFQGEFWWDVESTLFSLNVTPNSAHSTLKQPKAAHGFQAALDTIVVNTVSANEVRGTATIHFETHPKGLSSFCIQFNKTTIQDVIMILGPPSERFYKEDSRLAIFNPVDGNEENERATLFFNYFSFGMDICFDTSKKNATVKKLILHGNVPGSVSFQKYERCRWTIERPKPESNSNNEHHDDNEHHEYHEHNEHGEQNNHHHNSNEDASHLIPNSEMKFQQFSHLYEFKKDPVLLNRQLEYGTGVLNDDGMEIIENDEDGMISGVTMPDLAKFSGPSSSSNGNENKHGNFIGGALTKDKLEDWGIAELYGSPGLVVEVLKDGSVSSLTIY